MIDSRLDAEKDFAKLCGDLCGEAFNANNFTKVKDLVASPDFQLSIAIAKLQEAVAKQNREALKSKIGDVSWQ